MASCCSKQDIHSRFCTECGRALADDRLRLTEADGMPAAAVSSGERSTPARRHVQTAGSTPTYALSDTATTIKPAEERTISTVRHVPSFPRPERRRTLAGFALPDDPLTDAADADREPYSDVDEPAASSSAPKTTRWFARSEDPAAGEPRQTHYPNDDGPRTPSWAAGLADAQVTQRDYRGGGPVGEGAPEPRAASSLESAILRIVIPIGADNSVSQIEHAGSAGGGGRSAGGGPSEGDEPPEATQPDLCDVRPTAPGSAPATTPADAYPARALPGPGSHQSSAPGAHESSATGHGQSPGYGHRPSLAPSTSGPYRGFRRADPSSHPVPPQGLPRPTSAEPRSPGMAAIGAPLDHFFFYADQVLSFDTDPYGDDAEAVAGSQEKLNRRAITQFVVLAGVLLFVLVCVALWATGRSGVVDTRAVPHESRGDDPGSSILKQPVRANEPGSKAVPSRQGESSERSGHVAKPSKEAP